MIVLDTSVLIEAFTGPKLLAGEFRSAIASGEKLLVPALVLYEWLRGPRTAKEVAVVEDLFPAHLALEFGWAEARIAAKLCQVVRRPRGRDIDLAIAAHALLADASVWTLNAGDFRDIPGLRLHQPSNY